MSVKYRPQSPEEWQSFDREWCGQCHKVSVCPIPDSAASRKTTNPAYPPQWIFRNGMPVCTAFSRREPNKDLNTEPPGPCEICGACHQAEEPHELTDAYRRAFQAEHGRAPTLADTFAHTTGLIRAATEAALQERGTL